jgi:hypothetical protein
MRCSLCTDPAWPHQHFLSRHSFDGKSIAAMLPPLDAMCISPQHDRQHTARWLLNSATSVASRRHY